MSDALRTPMEHTPEAEPSPLAKTFFKPTARATKQAAQDVEDAMRVKLAEWGIPETSVEFDRVRVSNHRRIMGPLNVLERLETAFSDVAEFSDNFREAMGIRRKSSPSDEAPATAHQLHPAV